MTVAKRFLALGLVLAAACSLASAATISYTMAEFSDEFVNGTYSLTLPKFDQSFGTLQSVTLYFEATEFFDNFSVTSTDSNTGTFDFAVQTSMTSNFYSTVNPFFI
jgi:hypothetical protein